MENIRGKVYNPGRAGQLKDFSGLRWGSMTPTDVDAYAGVCPELEGRGDRSLDDGP